jgi:hypothetical protein
MDIQKGGINAYNMTPDRLASQVLDTKDARNQSNTSKANTMPEKPLVLQSAEWPLGIPTA